VNLVEVLKAAGGFGWLAIAVAICSAAPTVAMVVVRALGRWAPAALWLTTPALAFTVGVTGAARKGQEAADSIAGAAPADLHDLAGSAWPEVVAGQVVARGSAGVALLIAAVGVLAGSLAARNRREQTPELDRQRTTDLVLLCTALVVGVGALVAAEGTGRAFASWTRTGQLAEAGVDPFTAGAALAGGMVVLATAAFLVPRWRLLVRRRSLIGAGLCLLLLAGGAGAEVVAQVERAKLEQILEAPVEEPDSSVSPQRDAPEPSVSP